MPTALPLCLAAVCLALPGEWPQFRGPDRDGLSPDTGLLKSWPEAGPAKLWTVSGVGGGYSSVAVVGGKIITTGLKDDGKEHVIALNEADGKELWSTPFANKQRVGYDGGPRGTPTVADGRAYAVSMGGTLVCVDVATGNEVWSKNYVTDFGGKVPQWGFSESVLVDGGKVYATPGSKASAMVALDAKTGETVWSGAVEKAGQAGGYGSAILATVGGMPMVMNLLGKGCGLCAFHAETGKLLWQYDAVSNGTANIPSPLVQGDLVFVSTGYGDGGSALLKMTAAGGGVSVAEVVRYKAGELQNHHGGMVNVNGTIYFGHAHNNGYPAAVEFATGKILWKQQQGAFDGKGSAAVIAADGRLYFRYQNGVVALIDANPAEFAPLAHFTIPEPSGKASWPHPAIANGKLYLRDQNKLHCYELKANRAGAAQ